MGPETRAPLSGVRIRTLKTSRPSLTMYSSSPTERPVGPNATTRTVCLRGSGPRFRSASNGAFVRVMTFEPFR